MMIVSQRGQIFNFDTAHSVEFKAENSGHYVAKINYWLPLENPHLPGKQYLIEYTLGTFPTEEIADEVRAELITAFNMHDGVYCIPEEAST